MSRSLNETIRELFDAGDTTSGGVTYHASTSSEEESKKLFMEIPINKPEFELPTLAYLTLEHMLINNENADAIVVRLKTMGKDPYYKALNRYMMDLLINNYEQNKLVRASIQQSNNSFKKYYVTHGAVFDDNFQPLMMCSWVVQRFKEEEKTKFKLIKPLIRIEPQCFLNKEDSMQRLIATKIPTLALSQTVFRPYVNRSLSALISVPPTELEVKIEIDHCPFVLKRSDVPSISTTRESLLQLAIDHIDEFIQ